MDDYKFDLVFKSKNGFGAKFYRHTSLPTVFFCIIGLSMYLAVAFFPSSKKYDLPNEQNIDYQGPGGELLRSDKYVIAASHAAEAASYAIKAMSSADNEICKHKVDCKIWSQQKDRKLKCFFLYVPIPFSQEKSMAGVARSIARAHKPKPGPGYDGVYKQMPRYDMKIMGKKRPDQCSVMTNERPRPSELVWFIEWGKERKTAFTFIREPLERALTSFYQQHANQNSDSHSDQRVLEYLNEYTGEGHKGNYMVHWLDKRIAVVDYRDKGQMYNVIDQYNMIGLHERADESLVILKILYELDFADILHFENPNTGLEIPESARTKKVIEFMENERKSKVKSLDRQLWEAANLSLDATIKDIGERFHEELRIYRTLRKQSAEFCKGKVVFPKPSEFLSLNETLKIDKETADCYFQDIGCGIQCLKAFVKSDQYKITVQQQH